MKKTKVLVELVSMTKKVKFFTNELEFFRNYFDVTINEEEANSLIEALSELKQVVLTTQLH